MHRDELVAYLDKYLHLGEYEDYGPQGLQIEGGSEVGKITLSVDAALPVLEAAVADGTHFHLAHHGIFWGQVLPLRGPLGQKARTLFKADVSLYAVHLALDAHPEVGNNAVLAQLLRIETTGRWAQVKGNEIGVVGNAPPNLAFDNLLDKVNQLLGVTARVAAHGPRVVKRVGIVSGGGAEQIGEAAKLGIDTYITSETSHVHHWDPAAYGINVIFAGHYATEKVGIEALGAHLADKFGLEKTFLDFPTGL